MSVWKTENLPLAAFLRYEDMSYIGAVWEPNGPRQSCFWQFVDSDDLADAVAEYMGKQSQVEPEEYNKVLGDCKADMFKEAPAESRRQPA